MAWKRYVRRALGDPVYDRLAPYYRCAKRLLLCKPLPRDEAYNRQTWRVMQRVLKTDSACIDVGANRGEILRRILALAPAGPHLAIEPIPALASKLRQDFPHVTVIEGALSDSNGRSNFVHVIDHDALSGLRRRDYGGSDPRIAEFPVSVYRLDEVAHPSHEYAFVKIDCEGGEYHVLLGGIETIRRTRPVIVFEAGSASTGRYDVTPQMLYRLITCDLRFSISTMRGWLRHSPNWTERDFVTNWGNPAGEYYFIAYDPSKASASSRT